MAAAHLAQLQAAGLGVRQVARLTGVAASVVADVRAGRVSTVRPSTLARLLGAPATPAFGVCVPAVTSWRTIDSLRREGFTHRELGFRLGARSQQLQLGRRRIRQHTAAKVAALYGQLAG